MTKNKNKNKQEQTKKRNDNYYQQREADETKLWGFLLNFLLWLLRQIKCFFFFSFLGFYYLSFSHSPSSNFPSVIKISDMKTISLKPFPFPFLYLQRKRRPFFWLFGRTPENKISVWTPKKNPKRILFCFFSSTKFSTQKGTYKWETKQWVKERKKSQFLFLFFLPFFMKLWKEPNDWNFKEWTLVYSTSSIFAVSESYPFISWLPAKHYQLGITVFLFFPNLGYGLGIVEVSFLPLLSCIS